MSVFARIHSTGFAPEDIVQLQNQEELEKFWYKTKSFIDVEHKNIVKPGPRQLR